MPAAGWQAGCRPFGSCATACPWTASPRRCRYRTRAPGSGGTGCLPPWDGYQDRIVLKKRVWIDKTYIVDTDLPHGYGQARKRGLSSQQLCIAVGIDIFKNPYAVVCGHGKPSTRRIRNFAATSPKGRASCMSGSAPTAGSYAMPEPSLNHTRSTCAIQTWSSLTTSAPGSRDTSGASRACPMSDMQKLPQLIRLPVRCQPGRRQVARDCKGGPPYDDVRCEFLQLDIGLAALIYLTVRSCEIPHYLSRDCDGQERVSL